MTDIAINHPLSAKIVDCCRIRKVKWFVVVLKGQKYYRLLTNKEEDVRLTSYLKKKKK